MTCLEGNLRKVYFMSNPDYIFNIPNFCISDPLFERDYDELKNKYNKIEEKDINVILYYLAKNKNVSIETTNKTLVKDIKKKFAEKFGIDLEKFKIRLIYRGLELLDDNLLCYNGVDDMSKIHVMINPNLN